MTTDITARHRVESRCGRTFRTVRCTRCGRAIAARAGEGAATSAARIEAEETHRAEALALVESRCHVQSLEPATAVNHLNAADLSLRDATARELDDCIFDASRFPLVRLRRRAVRPGYAFAWSAQLRRLIALATPFVIVAEHDPHETADDARLRAAWLRTHRAPFHLCRAACRGEPHGGRHALAACEKRRSRVIYLPMIPEALFAMLACARIGAIHSVVFGGFAAPRPILPRASTMPSPR